MIASCSHCQQRLQVNDELVGKTVKCPKCGQAFAIAALAAVRAGNPSLPPHSGLLPPTIDEKGLPGTDTSASGGRQHDKELYDFLSPAKAPGELGWLGRYRVLKVLGAGGMGVVFQAEDPRLKRPVALKVMKPALAASETAKKRFIREAQATASIKHDHIVAIYDVGQDRGCPYLAMEFLEGESLADRIARAGKLPISEVVRIGKETAEGLQAAHERKLWHRDIKPANIWLEGRKGKAKILDFGLARAADDDAGLTQSGAIVGTPSYMAPEQAKGEKVDQRCDLFSLGCVLYRLCTGEVPFKGRDTMAVLLALVQDTPKPPQQLNPEVPAALSKLVLALLEKDRNKRPATAEEVAGCLEIGSTAPRLSQDPRSTAVCPIVGQEPAKGGQPRSMPWTWLRAARGRKLLAIAALGFLALLGTVWLLPEREQPAGKDSDKMETSNKEGANKPVFHGHPVRNMTVNVTAIAFSPDGKTIAAGFSQPVAPSADEKIHRLWFIDADTGRTWPAYQNYERRSLAFSPDGTLASAINDNAIELLDATNGKQSGMLVTQKGNAHMANCVTFSVDGKTLAAARAYKGIDLWNMETRQWKRLIPGSFGAIAFSRGNLLAACNEMTFAVNVWDAETGNEVKTLRVTAEQYRVMSVAFSPDGKLLAATGAGKLLATGSVGSVIRIWEVGTWQDVKELKIEGERSNFVRCVAFSPDGTRLAAGGSDGMIHVWDTGTWREVNTLTTTAKDIQSFAFDPKGRTIVVGGLELVRLVIDKK